MASSYNVTNQNLSLPIPGINEIFRSGNDIFRRTSSGIIGLNPNMHGQLGVDINSLKQYQAGEVVQSLAKLGQNVSFGREAFTNDLSQFAPAQVQDTNYTQNISTTNPYGIQVTDQSGNIVNQSPALGITLASAGATPEQIQQLSGFAYKNPGQPYSQEALQSAGATPKPTAVPTIPSVLSMISSPGQFGIQTTPVTIKDFPDTFTSDYINTVLSNPKTTNDILSKIYEQYQGFQNEYIGALKKSEEEKRLRAELDALQARDAQLQANNSAASASIQGQPIPLGVIGGQLQTLKEQTALHAQQIANDVLPRELQLKRLQGDRQDALSALEARLGFAKDSISFAMDLAKMDADQRKDALDAQYKAYQIELDKLGLSQRDRQIALDEYKVKNEPFIDAQKEAQDAILNLAQKYPDAGITMTDTLISASQKVAGSGSFKLEQSRTRSLISQTNQGTATERKQTALNGVISSASSALEKQKGTSTDGYVNPDTYRKYKSDYINAGGTVSNFFQNFPVESYISPQNRKGDLAGTTSTGTTPVGSLSPDQQSIVNDANARIDAAKQLLEDVPSIMDQIKQMSIQQYGFDPTPYIK